jgi:hypothetical protein
MRIAIAAACCVAVLLLVDHLRYQGHYRDQFSGMVQRVTRAMFR